MRMSKQKKYKVLIAKFGIKASTLDAKFVELAKSENAEWYFILAKTFFPPRYKLRSYGVDGFISRLASH